MTHARARRLTAVVVLGVLLGGASFARAQQVTWKAALFGPSRPVTMPLDWFAKEVAKKTNGQVKIELVYGEALAKAKDMPEGLKAGALEIAMLCVSYYPGKFPLFTVLDCPCSPPPPVGLNVYVLSGTVPQVRTADIFRGTLPFLWVQFLNVILIILFPQIVLWLPRRMGISG